MKHHLVLLLSLLLCGAGVRAAVLSTIELKEQLGVDFVPQVLHYTLELKAGAAKTPVKLALKDDAGAPVLAQLKPLDAWEDGSVRHLQVAFIAGVGKYETKRFTLDDSGKAAKDDGALTLARDGDNLVLASPLVAARIPAMTGVFPNGIPAKKTAPPISQIRGKARWYGSAALDSVQPVVERRVTVVDDGPIFKKVSVEYTFAGGEKYVVDIVLNRGEELVRVSEDFTLTFSEPTRAEFAFNLAAGLNPDRSVCSPVQRKGSTYDPGSLWDLTPYRGDLFPITYDEDTTYGALAPWSPHPSQWVHFACFNSADADGDLVGIINTAPGRWDHMAYLSADDAWKLVQSPHTFFTLKLVKNVNLTVGAADHSLTAHFTLTTGHREWAFFVGGGFPRTEEVTEGAGAAAVKKTYASAPRTYFEQKTRDYYWNSLDRIKDYTLSWPADPAVVYPHLYASKEEYEVRRARYNAWNGGAALPALDDPAVQRKMKDVLLAQADSAMRAFITNPGPPHHITADVYALANISDLLLGSGVLTPLEETRLKARLAYMAYILNWRAYWAPEMGYAANPNMTSFCYDAVGLLGLLLRDHPDSDAWVRAGTTELERELSNWMSEDGAWIESIHYVRAAMDEHAMFFGALKNMDMKDYYRDPRLQRFLRYYFAMQTPPDPEFNLQRGNTQIGNSYVFEPVQEFGSWAAGMNDVDPEFAGNLMWMYRESGFGAAEEMKGKKIVAYGAGQSMWWDEHLGLPGYYHLALFDPAVKPVPPAPTNGAPYKGFGAVLSAHAYGPKETKLYLREGSFYSHWDYDQGSIILWAKGAPLVLDHGYGEFHPWLHNRISVNHMVESKLGEVTGFFAGRGAGYLQGEVTLDNLTKSEYRGVKDWPMPPEPLNGRAMTTPWTRRLLLVKDADPDGPNYLVMRDVIRGELPVEWCLWVYGTVADFTATPIRATGKFGVDLLVYLLDKDKGKVNTANVEMPPDRRKQTLLHLKRPAGRGVFAVLFPLLPNDDAPALTPLDENAGVKVQSGDRIDWVFLPEGKTTLTAEGITFSGVGPALVSRRAGETYFMVDRGATVRAFDLGVAATAPVELTLKGAQLTGFIASKDARPTLTLTGPLAQRLLVVNINGEDAPVSAVNGVVTLTLPAGELEFTLKLK